ncbi:MAG: Cupin domain protein [Methanomassiliicoccales archaeon PtaB.Bin134]|jgi:quercetin dioxygenase-like cupin family protein|nr:MAG: Cupin domain protein [Methanomassiliicoccales archaeon PtaB.Bin134]
MEMMNPDGAKKESILGRVMVTKDLVAYQDGAVVSRTLINKSVGTVTVFSFDQGQGLSEHTAPYDAMVEVLDGEVEVTISGQTQLLKAGEMVIMPANQPHALHGVKAFKMMLIMIRA